MVTQDTDFGEIYYFSNEEKLKIAVIKPSSQRIEVINEILDNRLEELEDHDYGLFILRENQIREIK